MTAKALRLSQPALFGLRGVGSDLSLSPSLSHLSSNGNERSNNKETIILI